MNTNVAVVCMHLPLTIEKGGFYNSAEIELDFEQLEKRKENSSCCIFTPANAGCHLDAATFQCLSTGSGKEMWRQFPMQFRHVTPIDMRGCYEHPWLS